MGLFDGVLGGVVGAGLTTAVQGYIEKQGGLAAVVQKFEQQGLGGIARSWVGTGANLPIEPHQLEHVIGSDLVQQLAGKIGIPAPELLQKLAQVLPQAVDKMTPDGVIPTT
jgi:uncharacterized protein YidB (DUF937 family)